MESLISVITATEPATLAIMIVRVPDIPVIVDGDIGFGVPLNIYCASKRVLIQGRVREDNSRISWRR